MKQQIKISMLLIGLLLYQLPVLAQNDYYNQIASMEYRQWKFTPRSYYYSWDYKRVFGIKIPIPGMGVHDRGPAGVGIGGDNYVNEPWRLMTPLRATAVAEALMESRNTESEKDFWNKIQIKDLVVYTDRSTNLPLVGAKSVTADERDEISQSILDMLFEISELDKDNNYRQLLDDYRMQYDAIHEEVDLIGSSHEDNSRRLRNLQECNNQLRKLQKKVAGAFNIIRHMEGSGLKQLSNVYPTSFRYNNDK